MRVDLIRYNSTNNYTDSLWLIDGKFQCYGLEDEGRTKKVYAETRIPNGLYDITFRKVGRFHNKYSTKFGFHKGMLAVSNAPDFKLITPSMEFQYILIHIGNTDKDTAGCLLVGQQANADKNLIGKSTEAYKKLYTKISNALLMGEEVKIYVQTLTPNV